MTFVPGTAYLALPRKSCAARTPLVCLSCKDGVAVFASVKRLAPAAVTPFSASACATVSIDGDEYDVCSDHTIAGGVR